MRQDDGRQRAPLLVEGDDLLEIDVGQRVAADDDERLVERALRVLDAAGRPKRRLFRRVRHRDAEVFPGPEVVPNEAGQELDGDDDVGEAVPLEQPHDVLHQRPVG